MLSIAGMRRSWAGGVMGKATALLGAVLLLTTSMSPANAQVISPRLELRLSEKGVTLTRVPGEPTYLNLGLHLAALDAPFELRARRADYSSPIELYQVLLGPGGESETRALDPALLKDWLGLRRFFKVEIRNDVGEVVRRKGAPLCANGYERERINDLGPDVLVYPESCYTNPLTRGMVWGIEQGWAVRLSHMPTVWLPTGRYTATVSIAQPYMDLFGIEDSAARRSVTVKVVNAPDEPCPDCSATEEAGGLVAPSTVPTTTEPDAGSLPDLVALPAWSIAIREGRRTRLAFGATAWSAGSSPLVVEGFRREGDDVMDAYQYFYVDGEPTGRAGVGTFEFDRRHGHDHWHFKQFVRYSLLDESGTTRLVSRKEAFCLAPTDAVDLTLQEAEWHPGSTGLQTACGGPDSVWVRETLPVGWGDTYFQWLPGQSFNITDVPNGTYYIEVEVNPTRQLFEQSFDNNVERRQVIIRGEPGARTLEVPPWNGIDTESAPEPSGGRL